jgi:hypothetical protein
VPAPADAYQVRYAANLAVGDSFINLTNTGVLGGFEPGGNICANVYVFDADQQLVSCCSCLLTPNHLKTLSVRNDLVSNTLTPIVPLSVTVALLATAGPTCNAATPVAGNLVSGLRAWGTTIHALPGSGYGVTESEFSPSPLGVQEFAKMTAYCGFIQTNGSGYGICRSCRQGALGATKQ